MAPRNPQIPPSNPPMRRPVTSFPTPVYTDTIFTEFVSTETGDYTPLPYGTPFDNVAHTAFQGSKPNHKLVFQGPADNSGWVIQRVWASDRTDQQTYDYSLTYMSEDPQYPQVVRRLVLPRDRYDKGNPDDLGPLDPLTPDVDYPGALLVQEQMLNETDPPNINSLYITVVRTYQTLPGPITLSQDLDPQLNIMVGTSRQQVLSDDVFQPEYFPLTLAVQESPISKYTKLRIISSLPRLPDTFTEFSTGTYNWPTLVFNITLEQLELTTGRQEVRWYPTMRNAPNVPAILRTTTSFYISLPSETTLFAIPWRALIYNGVSFQISINNVLNDEITVETEFTGDEKYGDLIESHTFAATSISATQYQDTIIGTYQPIKCQITRFRAGIWTKQVYEALMI